MARQGSESVAVKWLAHTVLPVMDLWRAERFYSLALDGIIYEKVGMAFDDMSGFDHAPGVFMRFGRHHVGFFVTRGISVHPPVEPGAGYPRWALSVAEKDFEEVVQRVHEAGGQVGPERVDGHGRLRIRSVLSTDTEGNSLELVADASERVKGCRVTGLSHMHMEATDLSQTVEFYKHFLGLEVVNSDEEAGWVALGLPVGQHFFFHRVEQLSASSASDYHGRHWAFYVDDENWRAIVDRLHVAGVDEQDVVGGIRVPGNLDTYFRDPNGFELQITNKDTDAHASGKPWLTYNRVSQ